MIIKFHSKAPSLPDAEAESFARRIIKEQPQFVEISNCCVLDWIRAVLLEIDIPNRPQIRWFVGDQEVHFNKYMMSEDAWTKELDIQSDAINQILDLAINLKRKKTCITS